MLDSDKSGKGLLVLSSCCVVLANEEVGKPLMEFWRQAMQAKAGKGRQGSQAFQCFFKHAEKLLRSLHKNVPKLDASSQRFLRKA